MVRAVRRTYAELDFARHLPKDYIEKAKRTVPRKIYDNRFGAPPLVRWFVPPDDYVPGTGRPFEQREFDKNSQRADLYHQKKLSGKWFSKRQNTIKKISDEEWSIFPGDLVEVMIGKDRGKQGTVQKVIRESNSVFVDGLHTQLEDDIPASNKMGIPPVASWKPKPLDVSKGQVKLVDPNSNEACDVQWVLNDGKDEYIRLSVQSGYEIPIPSQAFVTYEYQSADKYIEVESKDTPKNLVLERTYTPKLCSFEDEIRQEMGIHDERVMKPTYWY